MLQNPVHLPTLILSLFLMLIFSCTEKEKSQNASEKQQTDSVESKEDIKNIIFFGNSLTAGYGLEKEKAFPGLIQDKIDSLDWNFNVVNAGLSGETTAAGLSRVSWVLKQQTDVFVLELGANDGLRGIPIAETKKNLKAIVDSVRAKYPEAKILLTGMQIPPNMGPEYTGKFKSIFPEVAEEKNVALLKFLLEGVAAQPELNLEDGIHPNEKGHQIVAENVWSKLKPILKELK